MLTNNTVELKENAIGQVFWQKVDGIIGELSSFAADKSLDFCQFGFNGSEEDASSNSHGLLIKKIKRFNQESADFSAQLQQKGIIPIAVLPKKLFSNICLQAETIYRFEELKEDGQTGADLQNLIQQIDQRRDRLDSIRLAKSWSAILPLFAAWMYFSAVISSSGWYSFASFFLTVIAVISLLAWINLGDEKKLDRKVIFEKMLQDKDRFDLTEALFPDKRDMIMSKLDIEDRSYRDYKRERVAIRFMNPPKTFLESLNKVMKADLHPCIAADHQAFVVDADSVRRALIFAEEARQEKLARATRDPILYVQNEAKTVVAICDYFGEFSNEKIVLNYVKKEGLSAVFN